MLTFYDVQIADVILLTICYAKLKKTNTEYVANRENNL